LTVLAVAAQPAAAQFTGGEQTQLVSAHNAVRHDVDPIAIPILASQTWSSTRASAAQTWANNCQFVHSNTPGVGENLYASTGDPPGSPPRPTPAVIVSAWGSEQQFYDYATNFCSSVLPPCGHYTQIAWRAATQVGCGITECSAATSPFGPPFDTYDWWLVVCQYNAIQSGARPYLCDDDGNGSATDVCGPTRFADGFEETQALPGDWGGKVP
jgi:hypothetical protein